MKGAEYQLFSGFFAGYVYSLSYLHLLVGRRELATIPFNINIVIDRFLWLPALLRLRYCTLYTSLPSLYLSFYGHNLDRSSFLLILR